MTIAVDMGRKATNKQTNKQTNTKLFLVERLQWCNRQLNQGSIRQVCVKFKDFSRTSKRLSYYFQGLNFFENTGLHVKILLLKC